jgi:hypothetical protein
VLLLLLLYAALMTTNVVHAEGGDAFGYFALARIAWWSCVCYPAVQYGDEGAAVPGESLWSSPTAGRNAGASPSLAAAGQHTPAARSECLLHRQRVSGRRALLALLVSLHACLTC